MYKARLCCDVSRVLPVIVTLTPLNEFIPSTVHLYLATDSYSDISDKTPD